MITSILLKTKEREGVRGDWKSHGAGEECRERRVGPSEDGHEANIQGKELRTLTAVGVAREAAIGTKRSGKSLSFRKEEL